MASRGVAVEAGIVMAGRGVASLVRFCLCESWQGSFGWVRQGKAWCGGSCQVLARPGLAWKG